MGRKHKKLKIDQNEEKLESFKKWMNAENIEISDKVYISKTGSCDGYGMIASEDIEAGHCLFEIPRDVLLWENNSSIKDSLNSAIKEISNGNNEIGWVPLLITLMWEYLQSESRWKPYLDIMFNLQSERDLPMFWKSDLFSEVEGTELKASVESDLNKMKEDFEKHVLPYFRAHQPSTKMTSVSFDLYKKLTAFVMSCSFTEPKLEEDSDDDDDDDGASNPPMMVPLADILNHKAKHNAELKFGDESLKMFAIHEISKGEEVFNTYGELANEDLLHMYGFTELYPANHHDSVEIPISILLDACESQSVVSLEKVKLIRDLKLIGTQPFAVGIGEILADQDLKRIFKLLDYDEEKLKEMGKGDEWESDDEEDDEDCNIFIFEHMKRLSSSWKELFLKCAEVRLAQYRGDLKSDEDLINSPEKMKSVSGRDKWALYLRYGHKKILNEFMNVLKIKFGHLPYIAFYQQQQPEECQRSKVGICFSKGISLSFVGNISISRPFEVWHSCVIIYMQMEPAFKRLKVVDYENIQNEKVREFAEWMKASSILLSHKIKVSLSPKTGKYGIFSTEHIKANECLALIPKTAVISVDNNDVLEQSLREDDVFPCLRPTMQLLIILIWEYLNKDSKWRPYLNFMFDPEKEPDLPIFWGMNDFLEVRGTKVQSTAKEDNLDLKYYFDNIISPFFQQYLPSTSSSSTPPEVTFSLCKLMKAFQQVNSFKDSQGDVYEPVMIPLADLLRHDIFPNTQIGCYETVIKLFSNFAVLDGNELTVAFSPMTNIQLLRHHGVTLPYPLNFRDNVSISVGSLLSVYENLYPENIRRVDRIISAKTISITHFYVEDSKISEGHNVYRILKLLFCPSSCLEELLKDERWRLTEEGANLLMRHSMHKLPQNHKRLLKICAERALSQYKNNLEFDELLTAIPHFVETISHRRKMGIQLRIGHKKLLNGLIQTLNLGSIPKAKKD
ncbi:N-lysine methyltransferase setd6 [Chamberlinius hualienensis]